MSETAPHIGLTIAIAIGYVASYLYGYRRGHAYGWQEGYFGKARDERNRRDHFGKFRAKNTPRHTL